MDDGRVKRLPTNPAKIPGRAGFSPVSSRYKDSDTKEYQNKTADNFHPPARASLPDVSRPSHWVN